MSLKDWIDNLRRRRAAKPPVINTPFGPVTEWARQQAAENMRQDSIVRSAVEAMLIRECGSEEAGMAEARRRYPEAYRDEVPS